MCYESFQAFLQSEMSRLGWSVDDLKSAVDNTNGGLSRRTIESYLDGSRLPSRASYRVLGDAFAWEDVVYERGWLTVLGPREGAV